MNVSGQPDSQRPDRSVCGAAAHMSDCTAVPAGPFEVLTLAEFLEGDFEPVGRRRSERFDAEAAALLATGAEVEIELRREWREASAFIADTEVGCLEWSGETSPVVERVEVHPGLRRRGIATRLWFAVRDAGVDLRHSDERTILGAAWSASVPTGHDLDFEVCDDIYESVW